MSRARALRLRRAAPALAALALLGPAPAAAQTRTAPPAAPTGEVRGVVHSNAEPGTPLPFAMVEWQDGARRRAVLADSLGRYVLRDVPAGLRRVRAQHVGHALGEVEVLVPAGGLVVVDLGLAHQPIALPALTVRGDPVSVPDLEPLDPRPAPAAWTESEITLRSLAEGTGMVEAGLVRGGVGEGGGGNDPSDPQDVLLMRGSTTDLKLVLLDGAPVYTPFHLGGLLQSFDPTTMGGAALHVGGAPARYDGGLSYILDLRTREPRRDRFRGGGSLDLMSGQASVEGPLGARAGVLVGGRALHDAGALLWDGAGSPYGYADGLLRFDAEPATGHRFGVTAFANRESVFLDMNATLGLEGPDAARWGNEALSAVYRGSVGDLALDLTAAGSRYRAELPLHPSAEDRAAGRVAPILASGETDRLRVAADATRTLHDGALRFGLSADRTGVSYGARRLREPAGADDVARVGSVVGGYVDWTTRLGAAVGLRAGLRADRFSTDVKLRWAPRLSLHWSLTDGALLTLAVGRYHQYTRASDAQVELAMEDVARGLTGTVTGDPRRLLPVATADHLVLALDQQLSPAVRLGLQGFVKGFSGVTERGGSLTSSGVDLRVAREGDRVTGWLGYSLAWFWEDDRRGGASTTEFTGRHLMSAGLRGEVAGPLGVDLRVAFSDGLPYTSVPLAAEGAWPGAAEPTVSSASSLDTGDPALAGGPGDGFLRIDAELHADLTPVWGGRTFALRPYVKVLNALDRRDALFWYFAPWRDPEVQPLAERSFLPVVGLEWRF